MSTSNMVAIAAIAWDTFSSSCLWLRNSWNTPSPLVFPFSRLHYAKVVSFPSVYINTNTDLVCTAPTDLGTNIVPVVRVGPTGKVDPVPGSPD